MGLQQLQQRGNMGSNWRSCDSNTPTRQHGVRRGALAACGGHMHPACLANTHMIQVQKQHSAPPVATVPMCMLTVLLRM
jgi:hypothetical protein